MTRFRHQDIQLSVSDKRIPIQDLKSHVNTLLIGGRSVGSVAPGTLGFVIHGIEQSPSSGTKKSFDGSKAFGVGDLLEIQIECRRKHPSGSKPPQLLAKALEAANNERMPCKSEAHHIVAWDDDRAQDSRDILARHNIDINSAENGVVLPKDASVDQLPGIPHRTVHTTLYHNNVFLRLNDAEKLGGRNTIISELDDIRQELLNETFPIR